MEIYSQITFFYYEDYKAACEFYENIFNFKVVQDQKWRRFIKSENPFLEL